MKKRITALALAFVMVMGTVAVAAGTEKSITVNPMTLNINGQDVTPTKSDGKAAEVFSYDGATYVPLRYLSELLGIQVEWDAANPNTAKLVNMPMKYTGSSVGMQGPLTVEMTVLDGKILNVAVTECKETAYLADVALERIPAQMVEHQTTTVDTVTGATFASNAIMRAAANAAKAAGLDAEKLKANAYHAQPGPAETWDTDVLVIGGGGAGLSAAISAAQNGAKVTLIEKSSFLGGNTFMAGGAFNAVDPEAQATRILSQSEKNTLDGYLKLTKDDKDLHFDLFPEWAPVLADLQKEIKAFYAANEGKTPEKDMPGFDSISLHMWHIYTGGLREMADGTWTASDIDLARTLAEGALDAYEWTGTLGTVKTASRAGAPLSTVLGAMWQRTHTHPTKQTRIEDLKNAAEKEGVVIYMETAGTELLTQNGKVVGAKAQKADGTPITINTAKGVVLACGGYCANPAMVKEYDEYWGDNLSDRTLSTNAGTNTGDGIKMAMA
ncbi:MAG: FAD-dependent oxidoreductase, partial [Oscillospiraceae bacterium]|nr:FAD-dependent oxidoreductase [Oscillospiraceae bacterium]